MTVAKGGIVIGENLYFVKKKIQLQLLFICCLLLEDVCQIGGCLQGQWCFGGMRKWFPLPLD